MFDKRLQAAVVLAVAVAFVGCSRPQDYRSAVAAANSSNLERLSSLYLTFQMKHGWRGPQNERQFKEFLRSLDATKLARAGVDASAIDDLFVSKRDGQPFKVRYGLPGSPMGVNAPVVFEAVGADGQRRVGFLDMTEKVVNESEAESLWASRELKLGR